MRLGIYDYNDALTPVTPIALVGGEGYVALTNDGLGPFTNTTYSAAGVPNLWNAGTGLFDWSDLSLGDAVDLRLDISVTTATRNTEFDVVLRLAIGGSSYDIPFETEKTYKASGPHPLNVFNGVYMGDANTRDNGARFMIKSDKACTVNVAGWYCKALLRI